MAEKIIIEGIDSYDGTYELPLGHLKNGEWHEVRQLSGIRPREAADALLAGDLGLIVALAVVALRRSGRPVIPQLLWDSEGGAIRVEFGGDDDSPPAESGTTSENGEKSSSSGDGSATLSAASQGTTP